MAKAISIQVDKRQLKRVDNLLKAYPRKAPMVLSRAVNKTTDASRVQMVRKIAKDTSLKQGVIFKRNVTRRPISQSKANQNRLSARIRAINVRVPLVAFKAKQTKRGVTYNAGEGRKKIEDGFIARVLGRYPELAPTDGVGKLMVLRRIGTTVKDKARTRGGGYRKRVGKLIGLYGPSMVKVIRGAILKGTITKAQADLLNNTDTQIALELERQAKK